MEGLKVEVDRCMGCGACVEACPRGAITLVEGVANIDQTLCERCEACVKACPEDAIIPWVEGEVVVYEEEKPVPAERPPTLARTAGTAIAAVGAGLILRGVDALSQGLAQWLARPASGPTLFKAKPRTKEHGGRRLRRRYRGRR